jgi:DNA polymerase III subunit delta
VIRTFSGDAFLAGRACSRAARQQADEEGRTLVRLGEGLDARAVDEALRQGGLFGRPVVALDLDAAFAASGGGREGGGRGAATGERNAVMALLEAAPADAAVFVLDAGATPARQRRWRSLGTLEHLATPRFDNLVRWVRQELEREGIETRGDAAAAIADLFGEDLPSIASELSKLRVLDEPLTPERVVELAHRPAARSAFQLIDAVMAGDAAGALATLDALLEVGEAPIRIMAAFLWQIDLVAGCLGLLEDDVGIDPAAAATALQASAYPTRKALAIAARLDEDALLALLAAVLSADVAMKSGSDPERRLLTCVLQAARMMAGRRAAGDAA